MGTQLSHAESSGAAQMLGTTDYVPLEQYGVIGNCRTVALVSLHGSIDWLCLPHFSGPTVFAALLDRERGGRFALQPLDIDRAEHRYIEDTNVLETVFHCRDGVLRLTDFMTIWPKEFENSAPQPEHELIRIAECTEGIVRLKAVYQPRPDDARHTPRLARRGLLGWAWMHRGMAAYLYSDLDFVATGPGMLVSTTELRAGETRYTVLSVCMNDAVVIHPLGETTRHRLKRTIKWWKEWSSQCRYDGPYRKAVVRSCLTLKLLTYCLSGAVVAAPTASLPEGPSGARNWDYRYCWLRDTSIVLMSFVELGYEWEGTAFLEWMLHATRLTQPRLQVVYDVFGETRLRERELRYLEGYRGIGRVRFGNAAHKQLQMDIYGEVVLAAYCYVSGGGHLDRYERKLVTGFGDVVRKMWRCPDQSIWEVRTPPRHHTYSKLMCWVALDRIVRLHRTIGLKIDEQAFVSEREQIRADIETNGFNQQVNSYVGYYGGTDPDASLLLLARHEYIAHDNPRMIATARYIEERLGVDGFLRRYPSGGSYDGIQDAENLFAVCTFWLAEYLARLGKIDDARRSFERLLERATDLGLYAEEFDARTKRAAGNFPQAFTHVELIRTALSLEAASRTQQSAKKKSS